MLIFSFYVLISLMRAACDFSYGFDENFWICWVIRLMEFWIYLGFVGDLWFLSNYGAGFVFLG